MSSCFPRLLPSPSPSPSPSKKAWRSCFTSKLQSKLLKIKRSKPIKHLNKRRSSAYTKKLHHYHSFAPVYVDDLFQSQPPEPMPVDPIELQTAVTKKPVRNSTTTATTTSSTRFDASVDERAEMFIAKFKQDMRLQRQKSLENYQEMLARSV